MTELIKDENQKMFNEFYVGVNGDKRVMVILDDNCVRYEVQRFNAPAGYWVKVRRSEFKNDQKEKCFKNALKVLNK